MLRHLRYVNLHRRSHPGLAPHLDSAAQRIDELLDHGKSEPVSSDVGQIALADHALAHAAALLRPGGAVVGKVFEGEDAADYCARVKAYFGKTKRIRPEAVRKNSREFFLVATGFRPST